MKDKYYVFSGYKQGNKVRPVYLEYKQYKISMDDAFST